MTYLKPLSPMPAMKPDIPSGVTFVSLLSRFVLPGKKVLVFTMVKFFPPG